jgi:Domain of unknown function (DUF5666)
MRLTIRTSWVLLLASLVVPVHAQETKSARGTVTAIAGDTVTVKAGTQELKFVVDAATTIVTEGGGTANRAAAAKGAAGPKLAELVKVGQAVEVSYREMGGMLHATNLRHVSSAGGGGGSTSDQRAATKSETANGTVTAVSNTSLTISGASAGGATFTQTYVIDTDTRVVGEGAGTASAKGKTTITDLVKKGARVTVTYVPSGTAIRATEVRVRP